jgi:hypothetical protein
MDRIFVSPSVRAVDSGYEWDLAVAAGSDHAIHWADLQV